jgi:thioredoxin reductase (NADPH)
LENLEQFEDNGLAYIIKDPEVYRDKKVIIAGGGDSALDWSIFLTDVASSVTLIHRRNEFRGALDSVDKAIELRRSGKIEIITPAEVVSLNGNGSLKCFYSAFRSYPKTWSHW